MTDNATGTEIDPAIRDRLALALDVDDLVAAIRLGRTFKDYFGVAKIGLELYSAAGPEAIGAISDLGYKIFLDLKLHDIPTTCLLYTSPSPRDLSTSRMPSSA